LTKIDSDVTTVSWRRFARLGDLQKLKRWGSRNEGYRTTQAVHSFTNGRASVSFDLAATLRSLATRNPGRTEADIQAMVRDVLIFGGFDLGDEEVLLESGAEDRHRLDVAVGAVIIECKRDIRPPGQLIKAAAQLGSTSPQRTGRRAMPVY